MRDIMWDVETLGTRPGSVMPSIGAIYFDAETGQLGRSLYRVVNIASSLSFGATTDASTLGWWKKQKPEAQAVLFDAMCGGVALPEALDDLARFLALYGDTSNLRVWGNGADFDNALLSAAYHQVGRAQPWSPWGGRCFRTLKNLFPGHEPVREGVHHNALADAEHQARWALAIAKARRAA